nr:zinc finger, CCHC-type [Tanacetum cinerariifolium]
MTTSVGNNSVFRSFFEKQKLTGSNFIDWYRQLHLVLSTEDKENYLEHPIPAAPVTPPGQQVPHQALAAHAAWVKGQKEVDLHEETLPKKDANPPLHAIRTGRVQKNQKNKPYKAAKGGHGKGKGKMGYASNNALFAPKPKTPPPPKKDNPAKDTICHQCGEGLWGSKKMKLRALSLYMGDGHYAAVEAIGTYDLELPSGLVIVLNNCHYDPSITRGVISISRLFNDGFINRFDDNNVILVSKNNLVYFMVVPQDLM